MPSRNSHKQLMDETNSLGLERIVFFSDAVMAIAITLLVIDLKLPDIDPAVAVSQLPAQLSKKKVFMKPEFTYRHSQFSTFFLAILSPCFLFDLILLFATRFALAPVIAMFVLLFFMYSFSTLTVEVRKAQVSILFGPGMFHKTIPFQNIENICIVDIRPADGGGIRWNPAYWIFNVSGDCAVEIELKGGDCLRVGSDEPEMLAKAIEDALIEMRKTA